MSCLPALDFYRALFQPEADCNQSKATGRSTGHTQPLQQQPWGTVPTPQSLELSAPIPAEQSAVLHGHALQEEQHAAPGYVLACEDGFEVDIPHRLAAATGTEPKWAAAPSGHNTLQLSRPQQQQQQCTDLNMQEHYGREQLVMQHGWPAAAERQYSGPINSHVQLPSSSGTLRPAHKAASRATWGSLGGSLGLHARPTHSPQWSQTPHAKPRSHGQQPQQPIQKAGGSSLPLAQAADQQQQPKPNSHMQGHSAANGTGAATPVPPGLLQQGTAGCAGVPSQQAQRRRRRQLLDKLAADAEDAEGGGGGRWAWLGQERCDAQLRRPGDPDYDPSTLHVPPAALSSMSNFAQQFWRIKARCMELVLFVRHGSFYNLFDVDADVGLRIGLQISGKRTPNMWKVGCHHNYFPTWAAKVLSLGYSVGRVEEMRTEGRQAAGKLLERRLVRIYTPGTAVDGMVAETEASAARPIMCLIEPTPGTLGCCVLDVASAQCQLSHFEDTGDRSKLAMLLLRHDPVEVVAARQGLSAATMAAIKRHCRTNGSGSNSSSSGSALVLEAGAGQGVALTQLPKSALVGDVRQLLMAQLPDAKLQEALQQLPGSSTAQDFGQGFAPPGLQALALAVRQLQRCSLAGDVLPSLQFAGLEGERAHQQESPGHMLLDDRAVVMLELLQGALGDTSGSLLSFLDRTASAPAKRRLRTWLLRPLARAHEIEERLLLVDVFRQMPGTAAALQARLRRLPDCERLLPKAAKALRSLLPQEQGQGQQQQQQQVQQGGQLWQGLIEPLCEDGADPADSVWAMEAQQATWVAVQKLLEGLSSYVEVIANLRQDLEAAGSPSTHLPLLQRAVVCAARCTEPLSQLSATFASADMVDGHRGTDGGAGCVKPAPGVDAEYDAATQQLLDAEEQHEDLLAYELGQYGRSAAGSVQMADEAQGLLQVVAAARQLPPGHEPAGQGTAPGSMLVHVASLQQSAANMQLAAQEQAAALTRLMAAAAQQFLDGYRSFIALQAAVAELDILAGFAAATASAAAPPGCCFCRPMFVSTAVAAVEPEQTNAPAADSWTQAANGSMRGDASAANLAGSNSGMGGTAAMHMSSNSSGRDGRRRMAPVMRLAGLWHPLLAQSAGCAAVANDVCLGGEQPGAMLLTGANTGGKSTLLRAVCLAAIMAQIGCYVPCQQAEISPVDACFVRIGAHDAIMTGGSTFYVEMAETARALASAGPNSLVVLDELGRGTSTYDGYAIAYAVLRHLAANVACRTLFATHYHRLAAEADIKQLCSMAHMASVVQPGGGFRPLFQLRAGPVPEGSCGIEVAAGAGVPGQVVARAAQMAAAMERRTLAAGGAGRAVATVSASLEAD